MNTTTELNMNMFESIKSAFAKPNEEGSNKYKDYLRTEVGNTYTVRLLPYLKDPSKTFFHYYSYTWNSYANGQLFTIISPATWGQRDPIAEERFRVLRTGTEEEKKKASVLIRRENWLVNAYIINDPVNPQNNGLTKIFRFGRQINKIVKDAMTGEEAADFGPHIFDLSSKGCSFKIKVEKQGDYPTYVSSKFMPPREIEGLDTSMYKKIYESAFDLESYITVKSYDEIKEIFDTHYHCKTATPETVAVVETKTTLPTPTPIAVESTTEISGIDTSIEDLLKGLDGDE